MGLVHHTTQTRMRRRQVAAAQVVRIRVRQPISRLKMTQAMAPALLTTRVLHSPTTNQSTNTKIISRSLWFAIS